MKKEVKVAGQIFQQAEDSWTVRIYLGRDPGTGKRRYLNRTVRGRKKDAQRVLNELLHAKDLGRLVEPSRMTLSEYLDEWLEVSAHQRLRVRTFKEYRMQLDRYVRPALGNRRLTELSTPVIQRLYTDMLARGLSARTVQLTHAILRRALQVAVHWDKLPYNPAAGVELPTKTRSSGGGADGEIADESKPLKVMTDTQAGRFLKLAATDRWGALLTLLLTTGLRPSEAIALKWSDIDLAAQTLQVARTLKQVDGRWVFEPPKNRNSRRQVALAQGTVRALSTLPQTGELVFVGDAGKPVGLRSVIDYHYKPLLEQAGIDRSLRLYDLRHTHATLLLLAGVNIKVVSERLGHASVTITLNTYSHVLPTMQRESAAKLDAMLFDAGGAEERPYN